jgi:hypothetical protein
LNPCSRIYKQAVRSIANENINSIGIITPVISDTAYRDFYFEYRSDPTFSYYAIEVKVFPDAKVNYKRIHLKKKYVYEEWTGKLKDSDNNSFIDEIINKCSFFKLPSKIDKQIMIKDVAYDEFRITYGDRKYSIGGYGARYYEKYRDVYNALNKKIGDITGIRYKTRPGK